MTRKVFDAVRFAEALDGWAELNPLRRFRRINSLALRQIAVMLQVADGTVRSWEVGAMQPSADNMLKLTEITGITPGEWNRWAEGMPTIERERGRTSD